VTVRGKPATGIVILLNQSGYYGPRSGMTSYRATTDQEGNYRITDVLPGSYQIVPFARAYVLADSATGGSKSIILAEGESVENVDFALVQGGVVTGKVTDSAGRPLIEQRVGLIPISEEQSNFIRRGSDGQTDDRGVYRLFGIPPGRYAVGIGTDDRTFYDTVATGRRSFSQTFYPNASDIAKATVIEVGEGTEATNIDISVGRPEEVYRVSGRVVDEIGQPIPNVRVLMRTVGDKKGPLSGRSVGFDLPSNLKGEFQVDNLVTGKYAISILPLPESELYAEPVIVEITDRDVTGVLVKGQKGAVISGVVSLEGSDNKALIANLQRLSLYVFVHSDRSFSQMSRNAALNPDLSFRVGGLQAGTVSLQLLGTQSPIQREFVILRVERDGVVQTPGLIVKSKEEVTGVRLIVAHSTGKVRGVVQFINGELPASARIVARINRSGENNQHIPTHVDERGRFLIENLAAGTYDLNVSAYWQGLSGRPPSQQQQVNVTDGETSEVSVVLDLKDVQPQRPD
jgi:hypothetical protein